jgi:hypothetical protein
MSSNLPKGQTIASRSTQDAKEQTPLTLEDFKREFIPISPNTHKLKHENDFSVTVLKSRGKYYYWTLHGALKLCWMSSKEAAQAESQKEIASLKAEIERLEHKRIDEVEKWEASVATLMEENAEQKKKLASWDRAIERDTL